MAPASRPPAALALHPFPGRPPPSRAGGPGHDLLGTGGPPVCPPPPFPLGPAHRMGGLRTLWQPVSSGRCPGHLGGAAGKAALGQRAAMGGAGQAEEERWGGQAGQAEEGRWGGQAGQAEEESGLGPCPSASDSSGRDAFSSVTHLRLLLPLPPPATARRVHRPDGPAAPGLQGSCPSALAALLCTHTGGCPEGGPAPPPRIGGQGQGALLGQDKALLTPRASGLEPRGCCTHVLALPVGTAAVIRGRGTALASKCSPGAGQFSPGPRGSTSRTPSVVDATLRPPQRRGEHEPGAHSGGFTDISCQEHSTGSVPEPPRVSVSSSRETDKNPKTHPYPGRREGQRSRRECGRLVHSALLSFLHSAHRPSARGGTSPLGSSSGCPHKPGARAHFRESPRQGPGQASWPHLHPGRRPIINQLPSIPPAVPQTTNFSNLENNCTLTKGKWNLFRVQLPGPKCEVCAINSDSLSAPPQSGPPPDG